MNRRAIALVLTLAALLLGVATGCGGDDEATSDDTTTTTVMPLPVPTTEAETTETETEETETEETETTEGGGADLAAGRTLFTGNGCGSCHTLADAGTTGAVGPNLDEASVDAPAAEAQIRNGGNGMPAFEGQLTDDEIEALAEYVVAARE